MNPFDYVKSINETKQNIMLDDEDEAAYNAFVVNRSLSYFQDTIHFANEMNRFHNLDNRMQYDFLREIIRKRKRFSKWDKSVISDKVEVLMRYYDYSRVKALQVEDLFDDVQIEFMKAFMAEGGG